MSLYPIAENTCNKNNQITYNNNSNNNNNTNIIIY